MIARMTTRLGRPLTLAALALAVAAAPASATTFCVPDFHAACPNNGTNVAQASFETAINANGSDGIADRVLVAPLIVTDPDTHRGQRHRPARDRRRGPGRHDPDVERQREPVRREPRRRGAPSRCATCGSSSRPRSPTGSAARAQVRDRRRSRTSTSRSAIAAATASASSAAAASATARSTRSPAARVDRGIGTNDARRRPADGGARPPSRALVGASTRRRRRARHARPRHDHRPARLRRQRQRRRQGHRPQLAHHVRHRLRLLRPRRPDAAIASLTARNVTIVGHGAVPQRGRRGEGLQRRRLQGRDRDRSATRSSAGTRTRSTARRPPSASASATRSSPSTTRS